MPYRFTVILVIIFLFAAGCGDDSSTNTKTFTDNLSLGTGKRGNDLVGEGTAFYGDSISIFWRAESSKEFASSDVALLVEQYIEDYGWKKIFYTEYGYVDYEDHVMVSSYHHRYGYGRFRATATLMEGNRALGVVEFTVQAEAGS